MALSAANCLYPSSIPNPDLIKSYDRPRFRPTVSQCTSVKVRSNPETMWNNNSINSKKTNLHLSHRRFAILLCYTGALVQTAVLTKIYLEFKTTTSVEITSPGETGLPAISICFFYKIPGLKQMKIAENMSQTSLTLGEINSQLPTWDEFVKECWVMGENYTYRTCITISIEIREFLSLYSKCFNMFSNTTKRLIYSKELIGSNRMVDFILNLNHSVIQKIGVLVTHPSQELDEALGTPSSLYFNMKNNNRATITYQRTVIISLPYPYESKCCDYSKLPCGDRRTCIKRCTLDRSYNETKGLINRRFTKLKPEVKDGRFGIRNHLYDHGRDCLKKYSQVPCKEFIYQAIMGSEFESPFVHRENYRVSIDYPLATEVLIQHKPSRPFIDYICFAASVLSLWTEISLVRLAETWSRTLISFASQKCKFNSIMKPVNRVNPKQSLHSDFLVNKFSSNTRQLEWSRSKFKLDNCAKTPVVQIGKTKPNAW